MDTASSRISSTRCIGGCDDNILLCSCRDADKGIENRESCSGKRVDRVLFGTGEVVLESQLREGSEEFDIVCVVSGRQPGIRLICDKTVSNELERNL